MNIHNASDPGGGSLRDLLGRNIGRRASASFLVGSWTSPPAATCTP